MNSILNLQHARSVSAAQLQQWTTGGYAFWERAELVAVSVKRLADNSYRVVISAWRDGPAGFAFYILRSIETESADEAAEKYNAAVVWALKVRPDTVTAHVHAQRAA